MGNSTNKHGGIAIKTEKPLYYPGDTVNGYIYILLTAAVPGNQVILKVKGKESSHWVTEHQVNNGSGSQTVRVPHYGHNPFLNYRVPIYSWNQPSIPAGQYCIPFSFVLPQNIPGSYKDNWGNAIFEDGYGLIAYKLKAELISSTGDVHVKAKSPFYVREVNNRPVTSLGGESNLPMKSCFCCSQGFVKMKCYFEKNAYMPGEMANVIAEVDNSQGRIAIKNMICRLTYSMIVANDSDSHTFTKNNSEVIAPGVAVGETKTGATKLMFSVPIIPEKNKEGEELPSTHGNLVKAVYKLQVYGAIDSCWCACCSTEPMMEIPIFLSFEPARNIAPLQAPANWAPQQIPLVAVSLNQQYQYKSKKSGIVKDFTPATPTPTSGNSPQMMTPMGMPMQQVQMGMVPPMSTTSAYAPAKI